MITRRRKTRICERKFRAVATPPKKAKNREERVGPCATAALVGTVWASDF